MAYPYDESTGKVSFSEGKVFFTCPIEGGVPDGHCQDEEGFLWVACHGTGKVFRLDRDGNIVAEIELPTRCVTCPAFAGTELFITSAAEQEPEKYEWSKKYGGALFKIDGEWRHYEARDGAPMHTQPNIEWIEIDSLTLSIYSRRLWQATEQVQDERQAVRPRPCYY